MGEVIAFPRPVPPEPEHPGVTDGEYARHLARLGCGYSEDESLEILAMSRSIMGTGHGD